MATPPPTILVHVVSPNSEVPGRLAFTDVPVTETIADLKRRIQDAVPSKPTLERQRIIYRGRALIQQDLTLQAILGSDASNSNEPFTFHLVLSPLESNAPPARPDGLHQPLGLPHPPLYVQGARGNIPPRPASTSQVPDGVPQAIQNIGNVPFNPLFNMLPQGLQPGQGVDIRMQVMQTGRPLHPQHGVNMINGAGPGPDAGMAQFPPWSPDQQLATMEQQMQAVHQRIHQNFVNMGHHHGGHLNQNNPQHTVALGINTNPQQLAADSSSRRPSASAEPHEPATGAVPSVHAASATAPNDNPIPRQHTATRQMPAAGMPNLGPMAAANLHALRQNHLQNMQLDQMGQFTQLRNALMNPPQPPRTSISSQSSQMVYLLSSSTGPEALLVSPSGNFTSPHFSIRSVTGGFDQTSTLRSNSIRPNDPTQVSGQALSQVQQGPQPAPVQQQQQPPQQHQQQPQQQQQDQAGDLVRILLPLGGHLWLLVRLIGFVYLFSGGRGWRNTIVLGMLALIGFLAQTGVFNPLIRNVWRPVRQHVEGIINHEHPRPTPANDQNPNPQQMADRLLERQGNANAIRRAARRVERSAILFAASLIPGVGESQVRARERAEREQREAEEAAERARQEAEQQAQNEEQFDGGEKHDVSVTEKVDVQEPSPSTAQAEQTQVD